MSNSWFQFKQFTIQQDACAMKVTTDACIQGAWTPIPANATAALDIGTGTSLLSLMLAQRQPKLRIDAIDTDSGAAIQATTNVAASPWPHHIHVSHTDVKEFIPTTKYDLIICNPPFFSSSLLSGNQQKDIARHDISLNQNELLEIASRFLAPGGIFSLLLPYTEYSQWHTLFATHGLFEQEVLYVKHHPTAPVKRVIGILSKNRQLHVSDDTLIIQDENGAYTAHFCRLLSPFYLHL